MILRTAFIQPQIALFRFFMTVYFSDNLFDFFIQSRIFYFPFFALIFFELLPRQPESDRRAQNGGTESKLGQ